MMVIHIGRGGSFSDENAIKSDNDKSDYGLHQVYRKIQLVRKDQSCRKESRRVPKKS